MRRDGDGHDVVDQERRGGDQPEDGRQVRLGHDVRAAAVRIRAADLAVGAETTARRSAIAIETWIERSSAPAPARIRTRRISSVAYADDEIASELKIASAFFFDRRSSNSSSFDNGRPKTTARNRASARPHPFVGRTPPHWRPSVGAGIPEERGVRPLDADPAVARLSALERLPTPDHGSVSDLAMTGGRSLGPMTRLTGSRWLTPEAERDARGLCPDSAGECRSFGRLEAAQRDGHCDSSQDK